METYQFTKAINMALQKNMEINNNSVCIGLGINDPKRIFGTTSNLLERFGEDRSIEPPTSENALTGIALGLAIQGYSVCLTHQRFDFALLSFDQIINSLAKWSFMFGKKFNTSLIIRLIVGRGWGQGPTHSQSYHSFLASIPGLQVYYPTTPSSAFATIHKGMNSGIPTIMIEHRWLHNSTEKFDINNIKSKNLDEIKVINKGNRISLFTYGYMVPEAYRAANYLKTYGINIDLLTTDNLCLIDSEQLLISIAKTKNLLLIEPFYIDSSITSYLASNIFQLIIRDNINISTLEIMSLPLENESTSYFETSNRYNNWIDIIKRVAKQLNIEIPMPTNEGRQHDVPGDWFKGPF